MVSQSSFLPTLIAFVFAGLVSYHADANPYFEISDQAVLGLPDRRAALGNPMKGLIGGALWAPTPLPEVVPLSVEFYNIGVRWCCL